MAGIIAEKKWKTISHIIYSLGASIVILGALFKLNHYNFGIFTGESMLFVGLTTEAIIFFISAFEKPAKEYDWSLVYPELIGMEANATGRRNLDPDMFTNFNKMLADANVDSNVFKKLGEGLRKLEGTASQMGEVSDASLATNKYVQSMNAASVAVQSLADSHSVNLESYKKVSDSVNSSVAAMEKNSTEYNTQMASFNKNLTSLNSFYEIQLKAEKNRAEKKEQIEKDMHKAVESIAAGVESAKVFKKQSEMLAENLTSLNKVYGNMLTAMNFNK